MTEKTKLTDHPEHHWLDDPPGPAEPPYRCASCDEGMGEATESGCCDKCDADRLMEAQP